MTKPKKITTVVNKHHLLPYDIYIGRGSKWGNPFTHLADLAEFKTATREEAVEGFEKWIFKQRELLSCLHELKGKVLACYCEPKACHGHVLARLADTTHWKDGKLILECSTLGDIRFSAFGAKVEMFGKVATIEEHYQLCKRFIHNNGSVKFPELFAPKSIYDVKGKNSKTKDMEMIVVEINGYTFPPDFRIEFYKLMWLKYLDQHPDYVEYLNNFDDFNDIFKGKSGICQADVIRQYVKEGRESIVVEVKNFACMTDIGGEL